MALVNCIECGAPISDKAATCPRCGAPAGISATSASPAADKLTATIFRNSRTSEITSIKNASLLTLLLGCFYFAAKGVWTHAVISAVLAIITAGASWILYPIFAQGILRKHLLETGWIPQGVERIDRSADHRIWALIGAFIFSIVLIAIVIARLD